MTYKVQVLLREDCTHLRGPNAFQCIKCDDGYNCTLCMRPDGFNLFHNKMCCSYNEYYDPEQDTCIGCPRKCGTCNGNRECTGCAKGRVFEDISPGECIDGDNNDKTICAEGYHLDEYDHYCLCDDCEYNG